VYVKYREIPEHQYWLDQSRPIRENNPYWQTLSRIGRVVLSVLSGIYTNSRPVAQGDLKLYWASENSVTSRPGGD